MTQQVVVLVVCLLTLSLVAVVVWFGSRPVSLLDRRAAIRAEVLATEARIDLLTRQTMQQMRDMVRTELRDPVDRRQ